MDSNRLGGIDLHIHSNASDGTHTPNEIIQIAARMGLQAISITDHDTLEGCRQAFAGDLPSSLRFVTGVEISVSTPEGSNIHDSLHILGYGVDPDDKPLNESLEKFQRIRNTRIHRIVDRLNQLGIPVTLQEAMDEAGDGTPGRPHVARTMVKSGYAENINDAFDRYLGNGQPACVQKERMDCGLAFELINGAGGIPVLAHPYLIPCDGLDQLSILVRKLCDMGLKGLEVYYPKHSQDAVVQYETLANKYDLLMTGGTDFHGALIPEIELGRGTGDFFVPYEIYEKMINRFPVKYIR